MKEMKMELYWSQIPVGKENAVTYPELVQQWGVSERAVRTILHNLSLYDNGDDYILVRSAKGKGFFRTDDLETIKAFRKECLNKGRSVFAPVKKINRVISVNAEQMHLENNLRFVREAKGLKQNAVCKVMKKYDTAFDNSLLSKMENAVCLPTPYQTALLANIYGCKPSDLVSVEMYW